jgi:hypothetical protein
VHREANPDSFEHSFPKVIDIGLASVEEETKVFAIIEKIFPETRYRLEKKTINSKFLQTF